MMDKETNHSSLLLLQVRGLPLHVHHPPPALYRSLLRRRLQPPVLRREPVALIFLEGQRVLGPLALLFCNPHPFLQLGIPRHGLTHEKDAHTDTHRRTHRQRHTDTQSINLFLSRPLFPSRSP
jgi:hypothetical protein